MNTANELIGKVLMNDNCELDDFYDSDHTIRFNQKQSFETLREYSKTLASAGLFVKVKKQKEYPNPFLLGDLIVIPFKIKILHPLESIVEKLSAHLSQIEQLRNTK